MLWPIEVIPILLHANWHIPRRVLRKNALVHIDDEKSLGRLEWPWADALKQPEKPGAYSKPVSVSRFRPNIVFDIFPLSSTIHRMIPAASEIIIYLFISQYEIHPGITLSPMSLYKIWTEETRLPKQSVDKSRTQAVVPLTNHFQHLNLIGVGQARGSQVLLRTTVKMSYRVGKSWSRPFHQISILALYRTWSPCHSFKLMIWSSCLQEIPMWHWS